jgi:methylated-DNA-[protein]-cysteine S-methyltransferase
MSTAFDEQVWIQISRIPRGKVASYQYLAEQIGKPKAARAVANACGRNQKIIEIPCHRVIRSNGTLGGYSGPGGIEQKKQILQSEGIDINNLKNYLLK